jgi:hypothetical protein
VKSYSFYGLLDLTSDEGGRHRYRRYLDNEYEKMNVHRPPIGRPGWQAPKIELAIVGSLPREEPGDIRRDATFKGLFTYSYLVRGLDDRTVRVFFQDHPVSRLYTTAVGVYLQAQVLEPIMYLKLLDSDLLLMHAAGVERDGHAHVYAASGGTGKTTFSIALLDAGFKLLGDDLLIVDVRRNLVYPYPRPLHLFAYNATGLRGARLPRRYRVAISAKNVLRFVLERSLRTEFLISTRVHAGEIIAGDVFGDVATVDTVGFLRKEGEAVERVAIDSASVPRIAEEIIDSADLNRSLYAMLADKEAVASIRAREQGVVTTLLRHHAHFLYVNPRKLELDEPLSVAEQVVDG